MKKALFIIGLCLGITAGIEAQHCYHLVWADEFNSDGIPSAENWSYDTGDHGWGNNELQNYTCSPANSYVKNGILTIRALKQEGKWSSARLVSKNKRDFLYGRVEVMARLPEGRGTWPAIWMLSTGWEYGGWPESGEIDIMEHVGYDPLTVHGTVHTAAYNHVNGTQVGNSINVPAAFTNFNLYAIEWDSTGIDFFVNNEKYFSFANDGNHNFESWPFNKPFHLILNIAIGGNWGGREGIDDNLKEALMDIDYVRVYSTSDAPKITGPTKVKPRSAATFSLPVQTGASVEWLLPEGVRRSKRSAGGESIRVKWGKHSGTVNAVVTNSCGRMNAHPHPVDIENTKK